MAIIIVGIAVVYGMIKVFATTDKNEDGSRGWNHTPNMTKR